MTKKTENQNPKIAIETNAGKNNLAIFEDYKIRRMYNEKTETWFFSVVDIIAVLIEQHEHKKAQSYWTTLKSRLKEEGSQVVTNCDQLKIIYPFTLKVVRPPARTVSTTRTYSDNNH